MDCLVVSLSCQPDSLMAAGGNIYTGEYSPLPVPLTNYKVLLDAPTFQDPIASISDDILQMAKQLDASALVMTAHM